MSKIGPADPEMIGLKGIIKKERELTQAKHTARSANGLNESLARTPQRGR